MVGIAHFQRFLLCSRVQWTRQTTNERCFLLFRRVTSFRYIFYSIVICSMQPVALSKIRPFAYVACGLLPSPASSPLNHCSTHSSLSFLNLNVWILTPSCNPPHQFLHYFPSIILLLIHHFASASICYQMYCNLALCFSPF